MTPNLKSHFLNLYSIALADTEFDEKEIMFLYKMGEEKGVPKEEIESLLLNPSSSKFYFPNSLSEKIEYLYDYAKMILADSIVHNDELKTLEKFCLKFGFEEVNISAIIDLLIQAARNNTPNHELIKFVTDNN